MGSIHPLARPDAFPRAGGVKAAERGPTGGPDETALVKMERMADMALVAAALARESGEQAIAGVLDEALACIGFRLAELTPLANPAPGITRRPVRQRRRSTARA